MNKVTYMICFLIVSLSVAGYVYSKRLNSNNYAQTITTTYEAPAVPLDQTYVKELEQNKNDLADIERKIELFKQQHVYDFETSLDLRLESASF